MHLPLTLARSDWPTEETWASPLHSPALIGGVRCLCVLRLTENMTELKYKRKPNTQSSTSQHRGKQRKAEESCNTSKKREKPTLFRKKNEHKSFCMGRDTQQWAEQSVHTHTQRESRQTEAARKIQQIEKTWELLLCVVWVEFHFSIEKNPLRAKNKVLYECEGELVNKGCGVKVLYLLRVEKALYYSINLLTWHSWKENRMYVKNLAALCRFSCGEGV